jgi:hypothetical protein
MDTLRSGRRPTVGATAAVGADSLNAYLAGAAQQTGPAESFLATNTARKALLAQAVKVPARLAWEA